MAVYSSHPELDWDPYLPTIMPILEDTCTTQGASSRFTLPFFRSAEQMALTGFREENVIRSIARFAIALLRPTAPGTKCIFYVYPR
jgi:hypothetical protein